MNLMRKHKNLLISGALLLGLFAPVLAPLPASAQQQTKEVEICQGACASFIDNYIDPFVILLTILIGVFAAISIIVSGIQYATSADDPGRVSAAKTRIFNTILGLVGYLFLIAFINYLVPGGFL